MPPREAAARRDETDTLAPLEAPARKDETDTLAPRSTNRAREPIHESLITSGDSTRRDETGTLAPLETPAQHVSRYIHHFR